MGGKSFDTPAGTGRSRSVKAGLQFPVARVHRYLKQGRYAKHIGGGAAIHMAAVLEYLVAEVVELAGHAARDNKKARITPRHLQLAIRNDHELEKICQSVTISQGGVLPHIEKVLTVVKPRKGKKRNSQSTGTTSTGNGMEESGPA
ncbi:hypothetical protein I302_105483 [Kwoniella bestiolae CBS 10118]